MPGLTGPWQVSGRNKINNFDDWVKLDLNYIDNWSLWLDIKILCMTIKKVITRSGINQDKQATMEKFKGNNE